MLWLGVPVLLFLIWVWVDSFTHVSVASSLMRVKGPGFTAETGGMELRLQHGMAIYYRGGVVVATPGITVGRDPARYQYEKGEFRFYGRGPWGYESIVRPLGVSRGGVSLQSVQCWFPFGFVVAGYAAVWVAGIMLWRRWMRKKWEASQVVEGQVC